MKTTQSPKQSKEPKPHKNPVKAKVATYLNTKLESEIEKGYRRPGNDPRGKSPKRSKIAKQNTQELPKNIALAVAAVTA